MKTSWLFEQVSGGGGGGGYYPDPPPVVGPVAQEAPEYPWKDKAIWQGLKARGEAPLPTSISPAGASNQELAGYWRGGYQKDVFPYMQRRVENLPTGPTQQDMAYGVKVKVPPAGGAQGQQGGAQGQQGGLSLGADQPFTGQRMMSVGGTPGKYSRADVQREGALASRQRGEAAVFAQQRDDFTRDVIQQTYGWVQAAQNEQAAAGTEAGAARDQYLRASQAIQRNRQILDKMQIDPDRHWNNMPESQKVLTRIGLIFGGLAEGLSGGRVKNAAAVALNNAIERDMQAQNTNMKKMLQSIDLDERDRSAMWTRWQAGEQRRRQAGLGVMQLQLSRAGLMEKRLGIKEQYAGLVNQVDQHMLDVMRQTRGSGGRKVQTPEYEDYRKAKMMTLAADLQLRNQVAVAQAKGGAGGKKRERGEDALQEAESMLPEMEKRFYNMPLSSHLGKWDWSGMGPQYDRLRKRMSAGLWRMFDSGKLSDSDMQIAMDSFFPGKEMGAVPGPLKATYRVAGGQAFTSLRGFLARARARMEAGEGFTVSRERRDAIREEWTSRGLATE